MPKAKWRSTQKEARRILAGLRLADGDLAGQVMAASDDVVARLWALLWLSEGWVEVDGAFRRLFVQNSEAWLAEIEPSKSDPTEAVLQAWHAIDSTMRIMGIEPDAEQLALEARARELAEAELRRRGFYDENVPLEPL